jgi:DsbC/DsbD-like thiol-disulfide interchange protein
LTRRRAAQYLTVAGLLAAAAAQAQPAKPAGKPKVTQVSTDHLRIRYASELTLKTDGSVSFVVEIEPRPGIHVYAPGADDYRVISLEIDEQPVLRPRPIRYPASEIYHFLPLNETIPVYQKPFTLTLDTELQQPRETLAVAGRLEYQACDDKVCFAPVSVPLAWTIR